MTDLLVGDQKLPHEKLGSEKPWLVALFPAVMIAACVELGIAVLNNSALPVYFKFGLKMDERVMGFILVPFFLSEALFKAPLGLLSDRLGRKPLIMFGTLITIFTPLILISTHFDPLSITASIVLIAFGFLRLLDGIGQSALWPALFAYVGDVVPENKRTTAMGILNVVYMTGLALGFLAGGFVDDSFGPLMSRENGVTFGEQLHAVAHRVGRHIHYLWQPTTQHIASDLPTSQPIYDPQHYWPSFLLTTVLFGCAAIIAALFLPRSLVKSKSHSTEESEISDLISWKGIVDAARTVPQYLAIAFITFFGIGCLVFIVKIFAMEQFHLTEQKVGGLMLVPALIIAAVSVPISHLVDRWGKSRAVRLGFILCSIGLWGIPILAWMHQSTLNEFVLSATIIGVGFVLAFPAWMAQITSLRGTESRGMVFGAVATAQGVGVLFGSIAGTGLYHLGRIIPFAASAALVTVGAIIALITVRDNTTVLQCSKSITSTI